MCKKEKRGVTVPNITISIDKDLLESGRQYAKKHQISINALIRKLLEQTVRPQSQDWMEHCFNLMDQENADSRGISWTRADLYDT